MIRRQRKRRLLFVIDDMGIGGTQKQVAEVVNRLDPEGFSADIVCLERGGLTLERVRGAGRIEVLGARRVFDHKGLAAAARLAAIIRRGAYDLVEAYLPAAHFLCAIAAAARPATALVAARRNLASLDPSWFAAAGALLNRATRFSIANSRAVKWSVVRRYGIRPSRIAVIPNVVCPPGGVDRGAARRRFEIARDDFVVAAAGTVSAVKDYPTILRAFAALSRAGVRAVLLVAGDGRGRGELVSMAAGFGLNGHVRFLGTVPDIGAVLSAADVFVHASRSEGSSNAVLEAMSYGLPSVVSRIPANLEALGTGCAVHFEPGDWRGCFEGLLGFAACPAAAREAGARARERIERTFDVDFAVRRRERLYRKIGEASNDGHS